MAFFLAKRWKRQPSGLVVPDYSHPAVKTAEVIIFGGEERPIRDLVTNTLNTGVILARGAASAASTSAGVGLKYGLSNTLNLSIAGERPLINGSTDMTILAHLKRGITSNNFAYHLRYSNGGGYGWSFHHAFYGDSNGDNNLMFGGRWLGATNITGYSDDPWTVGDDRCYVLTARVSGADYLVSAWRDGKLIASGVTASRDPGTDNTAYLYGASTPAASTTLYPLMYLGAVFRGALPDATAQELSKAPYSIFKPEKKVFYSLPATASGGDVTGQTVSATASLIAGAVTAGASVVAQTVSASASLIAGIAYVGATVASQILTSTASLIAGSVNAGALVSGSTVSSTLSLLSGSVNAGAAVSGQTVSSTMSLVAGSVNAGSLVSGTTLITDLSLIAGSASAIQNATVNGYVFITNMSLITGNAFTDGTVKVYNRLLFSPVQPLIRPLIEKIINYD